ncbi:Reticulon-like protein B5 [Acorus calamus]|uniref:Reticulon-like protein n=1 Tax=Acorus calamus TaxID=4465 RepID=A0AAV9EEC3_ACOCL|nr:Reticulon-like protein B5 [Acorus calamus]
MTDEVRSDSLMEKVNETIHSYRDSSSSSSDSDNEKPLKASVRKNRLFGRQKPLHSVLGGGKHLNAIQLKLGNEMTSPPKFPEVILPEEAFISVAQSVRYEINEAFATFHDVASGQDLKKFLMVVAGLWVLSVVGSWFNFLTLFYLVFLILYTVPVLYEKHEDRVDTFAEKAKVEINKQYAVLDEKVLRKLPRCYSFKDKKQH